MSLILFNKPYAVLCQFSSDSVRKTLAHYLDMPNIYPAGRLDTDSEGLMLLTDDGQLQHLISHPAKKQAKKYLVQVEGIPDRHALDALQTGIVLRDFTTLHCKAVRVMPPTWLWPRETPIRQREATPTSWLALTITEGKNRQVRRMTAAVGLPTLRLIRTAIGPFSLESHPLLPGQWRPVEPSLFE